MARSIPDGWTKVSKYAMTKGPLSICRVYVNGVMLWELYKGKGPAVYRGRDDEGAFEEAVMLAGELK